MPKLDYRIIIEPLAEQDGGGYVVTVPDLPGCILDGETPEEATVNVQDAIVGWMDAARALGREIPAPTRSLSAAE
ncbi:MAG: HicB family protein [Hyphomicrobiales bacterium]|nr:MAG: HicB family protein [Hyphomicrobiales bacterium]